MKKLILIGLTIIITLTANLLSSCEEKATPIPFNDQPQLFSESYKLYENAPNGLVLDTAYMKDSIILGTLIYEILEGNDEKIFHLNRYNGILYLSDSSLLDYNKTNIYELKIAVTDSCRYPVSSMAILKINILEFIPYNDQPQIVAENFEISEYISNHYIIDTVSFIDSILIGILNFEIINGNEAGIFKLDRHSGTLSIKDSSIIDYENISHYELDIEVTDSCAHPISDVARFKISIIDVDPPTEGLSLYLPFDDNTNDYSSSNNNGLDYTIGSYIDGVRGKALDFNGTSDYIQLKSDISCKNGLSFSFWMKPKKVIDGQQNGTVISKYDMGGKRCFFINSFYNTKEMNFLSARFFSQGNSNQNFDGSFSYLDSLTASNYAYKDILFHTPLLLDEDVWAHCLVNTTNTEIQIWVNGHLCSTKAREYSSYYDSSDEPIYIGNIHNGGIGNNNHLHGALDELRIYNRELSETEIQILFKE